MAEALVGRITAALAGRYGIERELGQGGMATVYLARDLRHDRKVALKVLRPELAAVIGAERFLQEIRVTAGLQHPHILPLHDSGEADSFLYYVMPFVEGESLRDRLERERQLPVEDAVRTASEVAAALAYAHGRGVIHRDIKPENILLASGAAVVADFGIARAVTAAGGGRLTETGLSLGTPQYMSPEQATADRELDGRSDVYALGAVLYEMLTGEPPHSGPTTQSVIAKLLTEEPRPVLAGRPSVPGHVAAAVHKSLARLPADRFRGAAEFADALARPGTLSSGEARLDTLLPVALVRRRLGLLLGGGLLVALAAGIALGRRLRPAAEQAAPLIRSYLPVPAQARLDLLKLGNPIGISPDGQTLVYTGPQQLWVRRLDQLDPAPIPNTQGGAQPFLSSDGEHVGFLAGGSLKRVALAGGPAITLCPAEGFSGASWTSDDRIVFSAGGKLFQVPASGGSPTAVPVSDTAERAIRWPDVLPDGKRALITLGLAPGFSIAVVELESGKVNELAGAGTNARFVESGSVLYFGTDGTGMALPFDPRRGRATGPARPVLEGVTIGLQGVAKLAVSRNGMVVYPPSFALQRQLALVDRAGRATVLATERKAFSDPRFAPNGRYVAATSIVTGGGLSGDIWVLDLAQLTLSRLTFQGRQQFPEWTADGRRLTFTEGVAPRALAWAPAGGGPVEQLLQRRGEEILEGFLTRDNQTIVYRTGGIPGDLHHVRRDSLGAPHPLIVSSFDERAPALSPDERWLAYVSNETGRDEVYVRSFPAEGGRWLVSAGGGTEPRWRRDGQEFFYRKGDSLFAVQVRAGPDFAVGQRSLLFTGGYLSNSRHATWDVHPDGRRFLFVTGDTQEAGELILVQNLFAGGGAVGRR